MEDITLFLQTLECAKVLSKDIAYTDYIALDLSDSNASLKKERLQNASDYQLFIQNYLNQYDAKVAYGGYLEVRNLYQRSAIFTTLNSEERNIHIGLDLWINHTAPVYAALDGEIHSLQFNDALGDYGPTLILKHNINGIVFHTLYGHLSLESLQDKIIGDSFQKGTQIATLGLPPINGDYAPHLHFQIIMDMENKKGDYPGVCSKNDLEHYQTNCPNPNILLKIN